MPLDRYGVLVGVLQSHFRDDPDEHGRWYHVNLRVDAPAGTYRCAIDVDSKQSTTGVQWKVLRLTLGDLAPASGLTPGLHDAESSSGAVDLLRHPALAGDECDWTSGSNLEAATALESILVVRRRILVWGEPFSNGLGVHNVHQNQGDPYGSQWWDENGIWQDGATVLERPDGGLDAFVSKFSTQASSTDDDGHPA